MGSSYISYGAGVIQWKENKLKDLKKNKKKMTMYGAFHQMSDVDWLFVKRKEKEEV